MKRVIATILVVIFSLSITSCNKISRLFRGNTAVSSIISSLDESFEEVLSDTKTETSAISEEPSQATKSSSAAPSSSKKASAAVVSKVTPTVSSKPAVTSSETTVKKEELVVDDNEIKEEINTTEIVPISLSLSFAKVTNRHNYNALSASEKQLYDSIISAAKTLTLVVRCEKLENQDRYLQVLVAVRNDNPEMFWIDGKIYLRSTGRSITLVYALETVDLLKNPDQAHKTKAITEINTKNAKIKERLNVCFKTIPSNATEFQRELAVHDFIVMSCSYDVSAISDTEGRFLSFTAYGAFSDDGRIVCEGYSRAMQLMLAFVGIECSLVCGEAFDEDGGSQLHMWNLVKIDGDYYYLDATWNDPLIEGLDNFISYDYFNITTAQLNIDHKLEKNPYPISECTADKMNYFVVEKLLFSEYNITARIRINAAIKEKKDNGHHCLSIKYSGEKFEEFLEMTLNGLNVSVRYSPNKQFKTVTFIF